MNVLTVGVMLGRETLRLDLMDDIRLDLLGLLTTTLDDELVERDSVKLTSLL